MTTRRFSIFSAALAAVLGVAPLGVAPVARADEIYPSMPGPIISALPTTDGFGCDAPAAGGCAEPRWSIRGGVLYMQRSRPDSATLVNSAPGTPAFNANQFHFDYEPGWEVAATARIGRCWEVEGRYMQLDRWTSNQTLNLPAGTIGSLGTTPPTVFGAAFGANFQMHLQSELRSGEINFWRDMCPWLRIGLGFRWIEFKEDLVSNQTFLGAGAIPPANAVTNVNARNDLYGLQLCFDGLLVNWGRFDLQGVVKAGVYDNQARGNVDLQAPPGTSLGAANDRINHVAFAGEASLIGSFRVTKHVSLYGGYQVLWMEGLALAGDNLGNTTGLVAPPAPVLSLKASHDVFAHGAVLGLKVRW